ncbi:MAG: sulfite exporter TauE/SafE family protein [Candidatus Kerfeldbacteria bacterium]|nr:sulfite exporter TauE/SafE family protein [Candidatus Kerfeldbacteria bacterium]
MDLLGAALLTFVASVVGTVTGFGTSTIMIPVLVGFLAPVEAIFLVSIIHWFGDLWKVTLFRRGFSFRLLLLFGVVGLATSYVGASVTLGANAALLLRGLGAFLIAYALLVVFQSRFRVPAGNAAALGGGALSGFFAGLFGIGGAIRAVFLSAFGLPKAVYIATAGAIGLLVDSMRIVTYAAGDAMLPNRLWWGLLLLIPVSFFGARVAKRVVERIPERRFRLAVAFFLALVGLKLIVLP